MNQIISFIIIWKYRIYADSVVEISKKAHNQVVWINTAIITRTNKLHCSYVYHLYIYKICPTKLPRVVAPISKDRIPSSFFYLVHIYSLCCWTWGRSLVGSIPLEDTIAVISCTIIFICHLSCSNSLIICVNWDWSGAAASSEPALSSRICFLDFFCFLVLPLLICLKHSRHNRGCPTPDSSLVCPLI